MQGTGRTIPTHTLPSQQYSSRRLVTGSIGIGLGIVASAIFASSVGFRIPVITKAIAPISTSLSHPVIRVMNLIFAIASLAIGFRSVCKLSSSSEMAITAQMIESFKIGETCLQSNVCQHDCTIELLDGRTKFLRLDATDIYSILKARREIGIDDGSPNRSYASWDHFSYWGTPENLDWEIPDANEILTDIFKEFTHGTVQIVHLPEVPEFL